MKLNPSTSMCLLTGIEEGLLITTTSSLDATILRGSAVTGGSCL